MKAIFVISFFVFLFLLGCLSPAVSTTPKVCFGERCVLVEIADTPDERSQGLMFRDSLQGNYGMLFVFESEGIYGFWMKNTLIPLDAVWMDTQGNVVDVITMLPCENDPCKVYTPIGDAKYVLEVNAGVAKSWSIQRGTVAQTSGV